MKLFGLVTQVLYQVDILMNLLVKEQQTMTLGISKKAETYEAESIQAGLTILLKLMEKTVP